MAVAISFAIVALIYSMVGFGGGSSYIAILTIAGVDYKIIPIIALCCNLIVVSGGTRQFVRSRFFDWNFIWPFAIASVPMAFVGGILRISEQMFMVLLGIALFMAGLKLLIADRLVRSEYQCRPPNRTTSIFVGAALGFLSGMVGIGGGIFLSPVLILLRWADPKKAAATASAFILLNSLAGLTGQLLKGIDPSFLVPASGLFLAVLIGGQIGSRLSSSARISPRRVADLTALLILFVAARTILAI